MSSAEFLIFSEKFVRQTPAYGGSLAGKGYGMPVKWLKNGF